MEKIALITGSTSGIGKAVAQKFAKEGISIALNGFGKEEDIQAQIKELQSYGVRVHYFPADLMNALECKSLVENVNHYFSKIDILINNAGMQYVSPIDTFPDDKWENIIALDLSASFYTIKSALPIMRQHKWGRIINISSVHGLVASVNKSAYVAAKHGLVGLTKVTALETAMENITCNVVCPGFVYTPLIEVQIAKKAQEENISFEEAKVKFIAEKHPSKAFVDMDDLAELIFFLTKESSKEIRGSSYSMDGGWSAV